MKTEQLRALLTRADLSGIYHLPSSGVEALRQATGALGFACFAVDLGKAGETGDLAVALEALGRGLGFPEWYGANLDALNDCLTDFSWNEAPGYVVILSGADTLHELGEPFARLNGVLDNAVQEWRRQGVPFWIFYDLRADGLAFLPTLA